MPAFDFTDWWATVSNNGQNRETSPAQGFALGLQMYALHQQRDLEMRKLQMESERNQFSKILEISKFQDEQVRTRGMAEISHHLADTATHNAWDNPEAERKFWEIAAKYPQVIKSNELDTLYKNTFQEVRNRKAKLDEFNAGMAMRKAELNKPTANQADLDRAREMKNKADDIEGLDPQYAAQLRSDAEELLAMHRGPNEFLEVSTDENGKQVFKMVKGPNQPTSTVTNPVRTMVEKESLAGENAVATGSKLMEVLTPENIGPMGVFNDVIRNRIVTSIFPGAFKEGVSDVRTLLTIFGERFKKGIKADSQINEAERKALMEAVPSLGVNESVKSAKEKIATAMNEYRRITRISKTRIGEPIPDWALTKEEIGQKFKSGQLTEEQARHLLKTYF